jgi:hypothetical protein
MYTDVGRADLTPGGLGGLGVGPGGFGVGGDFGGNMLGPRHPAFGTVFVQACCCNVLQKCYSSPDILSTVCPHM